MDQLQRLSTALLTRSSNDLDHAIDRFCDSFDVDTTFLYGIIWLGRRDYSKMVSFAERFGQCELDVIKKLMSLISHLGLLSPTKANRNSNIKLLTGSTDSSGPTTAAATDGTNVTPAAAVAVASANAAKLPNKATSNIHELTPRELFVLFDTVCLPFCLLV